MKYLRVRMFAMFMVIMLFVAVLPDTAFADESTTHHGFESKDVSSMTEIYVQTNSPGRDYPMYNALWEPSSGVLYGRNAHGGTREDGSFGIVNLDQMARESMTSIYYAPTNEYSLEYWGYLYRPALASGSRGLLVYMNFDGEADDCGPIAAGQYDERIKESFEYLKTLDCPVFMRIGGEMNCWTKMATPEAFIAAYRHIVDVGRSITSNVAMVFSPNYGGAWGVDMDDYYPGDKYVDWVGCSLYYNEYGINAGANLGSLINDINSGNYASYYGEPMINIQQIIHLANLHDKPVIITEGGSYNKTGNLDLSAAAADKFQKAFAFLPMVYPEIKCIVTSDYGFGNDNWAFYDNDIITAWYSKGVQSTGVYLEDYHDTAGYLTSLSADPDITRMTNPDDEIVFEAYTYSPNLLKATWLVDWQTVWTTSEYPYMCTVDRSILSGRHEIAVMFSNGETKSYVINDGKVGAPREQPSSWASELVNKGMSLGVIPSKFWGNYKQEVTRAEFCAMATSLYENVVGSIDGRAKFDDTTDENVEKMAYLGVVNGVGGNKFNPNGKITREQAAVMLARLARVIGKTSLTGTAAFNDNASISSYALESVGQVCAAGIMAGRDGNIFDPGGAYTREQSIVTIMRLYFMS